MKIDAQKYSGSSKLLCPTHHYVNQNTVPTLAFNTHALVALLWSYYASLCLAVYYQLISLVHSCMLMQIKNIYETKLMRTLYFIILKFFQMAFNDFTLLLCPINTGGHWEIAFAFPQTKKIIYINPLGERHSNIVKFIRGWRSLVYKRSMEGLDYGKGHQKWTISSVQHTLQNDSVNCGIFVMKV